MAKYLDSVGLNRLMQIIKAAFVTDVTYDSTNHKIQKSKAGSTSDVATIPIPGTGESYPAMDGTRSLGSSDGYARVDHVHPTDTSRAASSHAHGNITSGGDITATAPTVASGDKIIINDESASKITNGPSFGTDTTKYLRNDGSWAVPTGEVNVQSDWNQSDTTADDYIKNKPGNFTGATGSAAGASGFVPAPASGETTKLLWSDGNWKTIEPDLTTNDGNLYLKLYKRNSGTGGEGRTQVSSDDIPLSYLWPSVASASAAGLMSSSDFGKLSRIDDGAEVNVQSDWNQTNTSADDYIKNKPTIPSGKGVYYGTCSTSEDVSDKVVVCSDFTTLETGAVIFVSFDDNHYEAQNHVTLNVNSTGAKGLSGFKSGYAYWENNQILSFTYNGSTWQVNDATYIDTQDTTSAISSADKMYLVGAKTMGPAGRNTYANTKVYATDGAFVCDTIDTGNGAYEINAAAAKAIGSVADGNTGLVTGDAVYDAIQSSIAGIVGNLVYKGTVSAASGMTNFKTGWSWIADTAFTIGSGNDIKSVEVGDMLIANADGASATTSNIDVIQTNIDTLTTGEVETLWANAVPTA